MAHRIGRAALLCTLLAASACGGGASAPDPGFTAAPSPLRFTMQWRTGLPEGQQLAIAATSPEVASMQLSVAGTPPTWLSLGGPSGSWPAWTLPVSLANASVELPVGRYQFPLRLTARKADGSTVGVREVLVELDVTNEFTLTSLVGDPVMLSAGMSSSWLVALGGVGYAWSASADQPWISFSSSSGVSPGNLDLTVDSAGLAVGTYAGTITVTETASGRTHPIPVHLEVLPGFLLATPNPVVLTGTIGAPVPPAEVALAMSNGAPGSFLAYSDTPWLHVSPASGTLPGTLTVSVDATAPTYPVNTAWYWVSFDGGMGYQGMGAELRMSP